MPLLIVLEPVCPVGYTIFGDSKTCIGYFGTYRTWHDARQICMEQQGDLISLDNQAKFEDIQHLPSSEGILVDTSENFFLIATFPDNCIFFLLLCSTYVSFFLSS